MCLTKDKKKSYKKLCKKMFKMKKEILTELLLILHLRFEKFIDLLYFCTDQPSNSLHCKLPYFVLPNYSSNDH